MKPWLPLIVASAAAACSPLPSDAIGEALAKLHYQPGAWSGETQCVGDLPASMPRDARCYAARNLTTTPGSSEVSAIRAFWTKGESGKWDLTLIVDQSDKILWQRSAS